MPTEELHRSFQSHSLDALPPRVPKVERIRPGMKLGGPSTFLHNVGSAATEGSQGCHGCLVVTGQRPYRQMPCHDGDS